MALSGNSGVSGGTAPKLRIDWTATQSTSGNYSDVTAKVYLVATYNVDFGSTKSGSVTVNGQTKSFSTTHRIRGAGTHLLTTQSFRVGHSSDGSKSFSYSAKYSININYSGSWLGTLSRSGSGTLNTIPRRSSIGSLGTGTVGSSYTVPIDRASSSFTHRVWYTNPAGSQISLSTNATTSVSFTIPIDDAKGIPGKTGVGTIRLDTYSGSTRLGSYYKDFTISVPDTSTFKPSVSVPSATISGNGIDKTIFGGLVQGYSKAYLSGSTSGRYGASIDSQTIEIRKGSQNKMWGGSNTYTTGILTESGTYSVIHWVRDSRGHTNSNSTTVNVMAYSSPRLVSFSAERLSYARTTVRYSINSSFTSLSNKNKLRIKIDRKPRGGIWSNIVDTQNQTGSSYSTSFDRAGYSEAQTYEIRITISDTMGRSVTSETAISTSKVPLSVDKSEGIGVGKIHERGALDASGDIYISDEGIFSMDTSDGKYITMKPGGSVALGIGANHRGDTTGAPIQLWHNGNIRVHGNEVWSDYNVTQGSNSTGKYWRFPNGLQITQQNITHHHRNDRDKYYSYPMSFVDEKETSAILSPSGNTYAKIRHINSVYHYSGDRSIRINTTDGPAEDVNLTITIIGRWK